MFSKTVEHLIGRCYQRSRELRHENMTVEDLLLSLLDDSNVVKAISSLNGSVVRLEYDLIQFIAQTSKAIPQNEDRDPKATLGFQRVLQRAVYHSQTSDENDQKEITPLSTLVAIYGERDSHAVKLLIDQNIGRLDVVNYVQSGIHKEPEPSAMDKLGKILDPSIAKEKSNRAPLRIFVSYSHSDTSCLNRLLVHLKPLERRGKIECWSDKRIRPGNKWRKEIEENIDNAAVALLIVSADFLASDFIANHELPPLLLRAEASGTRVIPVIVKPCGFLREESLQSFQCMNDPKNPLLGLSEIEQEDLYDRIAAEIHYEFQQREA